MTPERKAEPKPVKELTDEEFAIELRRHLPPELFDELERRTADPPAEVIQRLTRWPTLVTDRGRKVGRVSVLVSQADPNFIRRRQQ